jgi:dipeptidase E
MRLLLLSNSSNYGDGYLQFAKDHLRKFIGGHDSRILFIPYAAVTLPYDDYELKVNSALSDHGMKLKSLHHYNDPATALATASCIIAGGGNTFSLLAKLHELNLVSMIRDLVKKGIPYVGWSAGSNIACPTIQTTNDMPVTNPASFNALSLIPFQINPHYTDMKIPEHSGESRADRLNEYITVNKTEVVVGLPEGMMLEVNDGNYRLIGSKGAMIFRFGHDAEHITDSNKFNQMINTHTGENPDRA